MSSIRRLDEFYENLRRFFGESLFRDKIEELDRQITMLQDINTPKFLHGSLQLYG
ncbi:MAG: flavohemoglobin expression-modulating QEGLA motif protein, partial [Desulfofustis sp.]|nr:flavohemoglobin expression-modulating QEGLA motif protein [Desulfofustis sp.]